MENIITSAKSSSFDIGRGNPWLAVVIVAGLFYVAGQLLAAYGQKASAPGSQREIAVTGTGEVQVKPDVARITLGVTTGPQATAKQANDLLTKKFEAVSQAVTALGVAKDDVKTTNLSINPLYDYPEGRQVLRGFDASQQIEIKIRNLDSIGEIIAKTTAEGVNQAGGIVFTLDKPDSAQDEAEAAAIADAQDKAEALARTLGVQLGQVKYYSASTFSPGNPDQPYLLANKEMAVGGFGGDTAAPVPSGTSTVTSNVTITYSLR